MTQPGVSVVIATRNRAAHVAECVASVLANPGADFELLVVDQSETDDSAQALAAFSGDARLRYLRSPERGLSNARNTGIAATAAPILAFTDDDCRAAPDWTARLAQVFAHDPSVALVCGRVRVPDEMKAAGFAIAFEPRTREWLGRYPAPDGGEWGIGANLSVRRQALERTGLFDPVLGAGAPLVAGEDLDLVYRVLRAGLKVVNASEVLVDHLGVRASGDESRSLWRAYAVGTAAAVLKHARLADPHAVRLYARWLWACALWNAGSLLRGRRPTGLGYTATFVAGSLRSLRYAVDRRSRMYVPRG